MPMRLMNFCGLGPWGTTANTRESTPEPTEAHRPALQDSFGVVVAPAGSAAVAMPPNPFLEAASRPQPRAIAQLSMPSPQISQPAASLGGAEAQEALQGLCRTSDENALISRVGAFVDKYYADLFFDDIRRPLAQRLAALDSIGTSRLAAQLSKVTSLDDDVRATQHLLARLSPEMAKKMRAALTNCAISNDPQDDPYNLKRFEDHRFIEYPSVRRGCSMFFANNSKSAARTSYVDDGKPIPPFVHFVWFGRPLDENAIARMRSYSHHNPGHQLVLWSDRATSDDRNIRAHCRKHGVHLLNVSESLYPLLSRYGLEHNFQQALLHEQYAAASDLARMAVLHQFGGTYSDIDRTCVASLAHLREHALVLWTMKERLAFSPTSLCNNDFLMGVPGHAFFEYAIAQIRSPRSPDLTPTDIDRGNMFKEDRAVIEWTGPQALNAALQQEATCVAGLGELFDKHLNHTVAPMYSMPDGAIALRDNETTWTRDRLDASPGSPTEPELANKRLVTCMLDDWRDFGRVDLNYYHSRLNRLGCGQRTLDEFARVLLHE